MTDERELVRSRSDIVELVGQRVILKRTGKHFTGLCPFHDDKNPSFSVDPQTGRYRCWSCQESGDVFTWVMKTENIEFAEALQFLAERAGIQLQNRERGLDAGQKDVLRRAMTEALSYFREQFTRSKIAQEYCANRGLPKDVLDQWEIGFAPDTGEGLVARLKRANLPLDTCRELFLVEQDRSGGYYDKFRSRLMFPIYDERSQLVAFGGRLLGDAKAAKYINSSDTPLFRKSRVLYGLRVAKDFMVKSRKAVLVEGYLDVIACHRSGVTGAVASLGTSFTEDQAKLLKRFADETVVFYDSDSAGQKAAVAAIGILETEAIRVKVATLPEGDDPDTLLKREGGEAVAAAVENALSPTSFQIAKLEKDLTDDPDRFWPAAVAILTESNDDLERGGELVRLAGKYPYTRDVGTALDRLTKMVEEARRNKRRAKGSAAPTRQKEFIPLQEPLQAAETIVFGALHEPKFQTFAWIALKTPEILTSGSAIQLAAAVSQAFPTSPPDGPANVWIHKVEPESMKRLLSDISLNFHISNLTEQFVIDSINLLRQQAVQRDLRRFRLGNLTSTERQEILERIRVLKPDLKAPPAEDDDPFS